LSKHNPKLQPRRESQVMLQQPLRNFLLASLLNFFLKMFLVASKYFKVDIEPPNGIKPLQATKRCLHSKILCLLLKEKGSKKILKQSFLKLKLRGNPFHQ
jgi:FMN-dependent NADH-azoreductase